MVERVVILGGGYAGLYACKELARAARRGDIKLTLVSKENFHIWHGFIGEMLTGRIMPTQILSPARRIFRPAKLHIGIIRHIDTVEKVVHTIRELDGKPVEIPYDRLIVAVGSRQSAESFQGLAEHGFAVKTWDDCFNLRNHIIRMFELASISTDAEERKALLTFFVAGGGFSGAEIAGEIADFSRLLIKKDFTELDQQEVRVVLAHPKETILPELFGERVDLRQSKQYPKLVAYAERHLRKIGVEVRTSCRIQAVSRQQVLLGDGTVVLTRTVISAVGTVPQALVGSSKLPLAKNGRLLVDSSLRVNGFFDIYAAGDCAAIEHPNGGYVPTTAWWGMMTGAHAAKNLLRDIRGKSVKPLKKTGLGQAVSIGRRTAVGELKGIALKGRFAWLMWRAVLFFYFPFSDRKIRLLLDWLIWPFMGRDIVEMSTEDSDDFEIRRIKFQPNEIILYAGSNHHNLFLLLEGEAIAFKDADADGKVDELRRIVPGEIIGHDFDKNGPNYSVKAVGIVKAIEFKQDQIEDLEKFFTLHKQAKETAKKWNRAEP